MYSRLLTNVSTMAFEGFGNSDQVFNFDSIDQPDSLAEGKSASVGFPCVHVYFTRQMIPLKVEPIVFEPPSANSETFKSLRG